MRATIVALDATAKTAIETALTAVIGESISMQAEGEYTSPTTFTTTGRFLCDLQLSEAQELALRAHSASLSAVSFRLNLREDSEDASGESQALISSVAPQKLQVFGTLNSGSNTYWTTALAQIEDGGEGEEA